MFNYNYSHCFYVSTHQNHRIQASLKLIFYTYYNYSHCGGDKTIIVYNEGFLYLYQRDTSNEKKDERVAAASIALQLCSRRDDEGNWMDAATAANNF